jgi:hypothetical protein
VEKLKLPLPFREAMSDLLKVKPQPKPKGKPKAKREAKKRK